MPETEETSGSSRPAAEPGQRRGRRHRRRPLIVRYWWVVPLAVFLAAAVGIWHWIMSPSLNRVPLPGYIAESARLEEEYRLFTGKPLDPAPLRQFDQATKLMLAGSYANAAITLDGVSKEVPVPAVFNDLGLLYMKIDDAPHALRAFRDALARNHDYPPVRANLKSLNLGEAVDPGAAELEPNNSNAQANAVWLDTPVQATITPSIGDVDCFWFTTARPPRDRVAIEIVNRSATLIPRLRLYDEGGNLVTGLKEAPGPGMPLRLDFSPPPNTLYYVQVEGASGTGGDYTLTVSALRAFDVYEPNDTIVTATQIALGHTIDANIMDPDDIDFYSFLSPVAAAVNIDLVGGSGTLVLGLGAFAPDLRSTGFAPDAKGPEAPVHYQMQLEANQLYYVQVFSRDNTAGPYSLTVK
jgi:hypothetical protein